MRLAVLSILLSGFQLSFSQPLSFLELGFEPAYCRLYSTQSGGGVLFCSATGGTPDYIYEWEELATGITSNSTTWGNRNAGYYKITVTDDALTTLVDTVLLDSLSPIANFDVITDDLDPVPDGWVGFFHAAVQFENLSSNFANPIDPFADTLFRWNYTFPWGAWHIKTNLNPTEVVNFWSPNSYNVALVAVNKNGCTDTINKTIGIFGPAGDPELTTVEMFNLTFDQESEMIKIGNSFQEPATLRIFNMAGEIIDEFTIEPGDVNLPFTHENGIYVYEAAILGSAKRVAKGKFVY